MQAVPSDVTVLTDFLRSEDFLDLPDLLEQPFIPKEKVMEFTSYIALCILNLRIVGFQDRVTAPLGFQDLVLFDFRTPSFGGPF